MDQERLFIYQASLYVLGFWIIELMASRLLATFRFYYHISFLLDYLDYLLYALLFALLLSSSFLLKSKGLRASAILILVYFMLLTLKSIIISFFPDPEKLPLLLYGFIGLIALVLSRFFAIFYYKGSASIILISLSGLIALSYKCAELFSFNFHHIRPELGLAVFYIYNVLAIIAVILAIMKVRSDSLKRDGQEI
ncbi:hypothetical protein [Thermoplasma volcanium]|uniref:hypothetical protein n=1 Tax=Thermoplasma volcanium TaxID=50339 RepID=UPI0000164E2B|nr:hypothetical protein [Thermoplasma volcanium]